MADEADLAGDLIDGEMESILAARRRESERRIARGSAVTCDECGDTIPRERRKKNPGVRTCVPCQTELEKVRMRR